MHTRYGPPEVVQVQEVEKPVPSAREVLIQVYATTVNRTDCGFRSAEYFISRFFSGLFKPKFHILGNEFAGVIESVGKEVTLFKPGYKVFGYNDTTFGAHAQYMVIPENGAIATIPEGLAYQQAAPILEGAHYALRDIQAAHIQAGQQVLVNGATGAIGSAAVQLIKHIDAEVTAVCATPHLALVESLGADQVMDYTREDFTRLNKKFDVVFDAVGKSTFGKCKPLLKEKGIYMSTELGPGSQNPFLALITPFTGGKKVLFPLPTIHKEDVLFLKKLVETKQYTPLIDRTYSLDQIVEAYQYVETRQKIGNVVINVNH
ncbi:NAD(P)-dependent alcohol dehydrogenase [Rhodocytophaga rosea]|uniref:NAD(P)-dependent alcohol dehydrogenase n=1 Tax=Rhodocytophaga rosea TaxID=2704465 RepID=A0A6C0GVJ1_9BACT|nr:NAD(P)-dependent alcohol dehydrogenase [Rhodocytophaga rosea]